MDRQADDFTMESRNEDQSANWQDTNGVSPAFNKFAEVLIPCLAAPSGAEFLLRGAEVSIGRPDKKGKWTPTIDLSEEKYGDTVSHRHAVLVRRGIQWSVYEIPEGTANGTYLNGRRVTPGEPFDLHDKDLLRLGWVELTFYHRK